MTGRIIIENLRKEFDGRTAIDGLDLTLPETGIIALCGPSGCGKSTLLAILAGLEKPTSGKITAPQNVSMSFQDPCLFPWRTAAENVNAVLGDRRRTLPAAEELLARLGIDAQSAAMYPAALSGGMRARVGIARALARRAPLYLFDEPFAALDAATAAAVSDAIREYTAGALAVCVIHNAALAASFADVIVTFDSIPMRTYTLTGRGADASAEMLPHPLESALLQP